MTIIKQWKNSSVGLVALLVTILLSSCGGGSWDSRPDGGVDPDIETPVVPTVMVNNPGSNATNVAVNSGINATFSVPMDGSTINDTTFIVTGPNAAEVDGAVTYSSANRTATFLPDDDLEFGTIYNAEISTGVRNELGTNLAAYSWSFTTLAEEVVFIDVPETNPFDEAVEVCTNKSVTVIFSSPMDPDTIESPALNFLLVETENGTEIDGSVSLDEAGATATFTPASPLDADVEYTATLTTDVTDLEGNALEVDRVWTFTTNDAICQEAITLGATESYGVLSNTSVTLGGSGLLVDGDVGIFPAGACQGCDTTTVSGAIDIGNTAASDAMIALEASYEEAVNRSTNRCTIIDSGMLTTNPSATCGGGANGVFTPGLYWSATSIEIPVDGTITLDAQNNSDAVFIFQSESTVGSGNNSHVILANGAQAKNVFWVAGSSATIGGMNADFAGTVIALIGITVSADTEMTGRALARGAAVVVEAGALITVPTE